MRKFLVSIEGDGLVEVEAPAFQWPAKDEPCIRVGNLTVSKSKVISVKELPPLPLEEISELKQRIKEMEDRHWLASIYDENRELRSEVKRLTSEVKLLSDELHLIKNPPPQEEAQEESLNQ